MSVLSGISEYFQNVYAHSIGAFFNPSSFLSFWPLFVAFLAAFAIVYYRMRAPGKQIRARQVMRALFPRRIFLHQSAMVDYLIYIINNGFLFFISLSVIVTPALFSNGIINVAEIAGISVGASSDSLIEKILFTIVVILAWDFGATYAHYLKHKIPFLWEFHKVHHSAEVMTPVTAMRRHPLEHIFGTLITSGFIGTAIGFWYVIVGYGIQPLAIFGIWSGIYLWRLLGYNLRHTHIWISYGNFWSRIFISPAQHQVHHSVEPEHYDKNFGHIFAFWDTLLGTLHLPAHDERVKFGIEEQDMEQFQTLRGIYWTPFVKGIRLVSKAIRKPLRP